METIAKNGAKQKSRKKVVDAVHDKVKSWVAQKDFVLKQNDYADLIDIKRTKAKRYTARATLNFFIGLSMALSTIILVFNWKFYSDRELVLLANETAAFEEVQEIPITQQPPPPAPKVIQQPTVIAVPDEILLDDIEVNLDVEITEDMTIKEVEFVMEEIEEEIAEEIFHIVEDAPTPIGGFSAFYRYVGESLTYPNSARRLGIQGKVFIGFVVDRDGTIIDAKVMKGIGGGCDEEALRVVENASIWNPGRQRGRPVKVYMTLPITFELIKNGL